VDPQSLASILEELLERGYAPPIHCAVLGANGSLLAALFREDAGDGRLSSTCTARYFLDEGFALPINMLFVDSRGEAMRVLVGSDACARFLS
jgi:hypothetical protein